jgi:hypothetical protein
LPQNPSQAAIMDWIRTVSRAYGVPAPLIFSNADHESNFVQWSGDGRVLTSSAGAVGIMQTIPRFVPDSWGLDVVGSWHDNVIAGIRELAGYYTQFNSWRDAFAAYAAGPGNLGGGYTSADRKLGTARDTYDWHGWNGDPNPNAPFDPKNPAPKGGGDPPKRNNSYLHVDTWMSRFTNGHVDPGAMVRLGDTDNFGHPLELRPDAAAAFAAMDAAAKKDGIDLLHSIGNAYRDYALQAQLWEQSKHGTLFQCAPPGHSNHGYGIAFDLPTTNAKAWQWVTDHGTEFGFSGTTTPGDAPHFDFAPRGTVGAASKWQYAVSYTKGDGWSVATLAPKTGVPAGGTGGGGPGSNPTTSGPSGGGTNRAELESILRGFGINPDAFDDLIDKSIRSQWSGAQFVSAIYASDTFHNLFPGIFRNNGALRMSPADYMQMAANYRDQARAFGIHIDRDRVGQLITKDVSLDEWKARLGIMKTAQNSEHFRKTFNTILTAQGHKPLGAGQWGDFIAGKADNALYDLYEASAIKSAIPMTARGALGVAHKLDEPGTIATTASLQDLYRRVRAVQHLVAPELRNAGITNADLTLIQAGMDPHGKASILDQIIKNRQALTLPRVSTTASRTVGLFPGPAEAL